VQARILSADAVKRLAFRLLMPIGYRMADLKFQQKKPNLFWTMLYSLADIALFRPIRGSLGLSNARICYTTGAILSPDAFRFYHALNLALKNLYGSTEGGALTGARSDDIRLETVGPVHKGATIKVTDRGEFIYRQPGTFVGYYKDPEKTAEVLRDGWFYSGDSGFIREDGHVVFVDRIKDLVDLAGGDRLAPQFIESRLRFSPYIKDAWVLARPGGDCTAAIIIINYDNVSRWAGERKVPFNTFAELSQRPEIYELVKHDLERINSALSPGARIRKYVNLHKEFDPDEGELTRTRKLRRRFLEERYREIIDAIYGDKTEVPVEARIRYQDGRMGKVKTTLGIRSV